MDKPIVVVGAGQAAISFISRHKALEQKRPIILIGDESVPPYQRPPLSKKYISGELERERLFIRPQQWYIDQEVRTCFDTRVSAIQRAEQRVETNSGEIIDYHKLILCTGSSARELPAQIGGELDCVYTLRSISDAEVIAPLLQPGHRLVIIGGGYIGLEAAAVARKFGLEVSVIEMAERILQRVASPQTSDFFRTLHRSNDVDIRESTGLAKLNSEAGRVNSVSLSNGETLAADLVLVGIGGSANTELALQAELECDNGIAVNASCQTSDAHIYAAGDCCSFLRNGNRIRLESVQNASDQGDLIARVLSGEDLSYDALPWFWSDQFDCKLQIAGLNTGYTETVLRPGSKPGGQSIWYYAGDQLLAVDAMSDPPAYAWGRKLIAAGIHPTRAQVADPEVVLKSLMT